VSSGAGRAANNALRLALELAALTALSAWGWHTGSNQPARLVLAAGAPLLAAAVWGQFVAPRAPRYLGLLGRLVVEAAVFGLAALALVDFGRPGLGEAFALLAVLNTVLVHAWGQGIQARVASADRLDAAARH
jgi:Protein of unknown function (DUF2568)